ncbi:hypothetical protein Q5P01_000344 [Channa striata]|uniref:Uncharacterized protein n=1 Tax=Channa striata TaxID=64152 RepID=A0AA88IXV6_CHASR|nr:hypothetical protein Q5P01_000344 [Channa striata]
MTAAQRRLNTGQSAELVVVQTDTSHIVRPYMTNTPSVTTLSTDPVGNTSRDVMDTSHWEPELSMKEEWEHWLNSDLFGQRLADMLHVPVAAKAMKTAAFGV